MVNNELMEKVSTMMNSPELIFLKGQIRNIVQSSKGDGSLYYLADIRVPRSTNLDNVYEVSFNICHVCFSSEFVKANNITIETMKQFKDNEVLLNVAINSSVKSFKGSDGNTYKGNNIKFFVEDIILLNAINKPCVSAPKKVIAI